MTHRSSPKGEHQEISELIPWYLNDTIGEAERERVDSHLGTCGACHAEFLQERRLYQEMIADTGVEYMPAASLKRLQSRLDELGSAAAARVDAGSSKSAVRRPFLRGPMRWRHLTAATVAVCAVAVGLLLADQWIQYRARDLPAKWHTVTASERRPPDEVIRAVFAPAITLVELQAILDEAQLRIISGPTEAGVYSLAAKSSRPVSSSLALLRAHAAVRFAESTQLDRRPQSANAPSEPP